MDCSTLTTLHPVEVPCLHVELRTPVYTEACQLETWKVNALTNAAGLCRLVFLEFLRDFGYNLQKISCLCKHLHNKCWCQASCNHQGLSASCNIKHIPNGWLTSGCADLSNVNLLALSYSTTFELWKRLHIWFSYVFILGLRNSDTLFGWLQGGNSTSSKGLWSAFKERNLNGLGG